MAKTLRLKCPRQGEAFCGWSLGHLFLLWCFGVRFFVFEEGMWRWLGWHTACWWFAMASHSYMEHLWWITIFSKRCCHDLGDMSALGPFYVSQREHFKNPYNFLRKENQITATHQTIEFGMVPTFFAGKPPFSSLRPRKVYSLSTSAPQTRGVHLRGRCSRRFSRRSRRSGGLRRETCRSWCWWSWGPQQNEWIENNWSPNGNHCWDLLGTFVLYHQSGGLSGCYVCKAL